MAFTDTMKRQHEEDGKPSHLPAITLADKDNYKLSLFTDDKDTYRLNLRWNSSNNDIPSISIHPQHLDNGKAENKLCSKHNFTTYKSPDTSLPCLSTPNTLASNSLIDYPAIAKEETCSESLDENEFHEDSPLLHDRIHEVDSPIVQSDPLLLERDISSIKNRITNIEMCIQNLHSMVSEVYEWVQTQKNPIVIESVQTTTTNSSTPETLQNGDSSYIQQVANTANSLPTSFLHSSHSHKHFVEFPTEYEVLELKRRSNTRRNFAAKLALRIFGEEGLMLNNSSGKCPEGTIGKLDSTKMMLIKSLVFQHWPLQETEAISQEDFWKLECMRAIDEKGRYLRFQKKSLYKRMLWKKRSGVVASVDQLNFRNFIPPTLYPSNSDLDNAHTPTSSAPVGTYSVTLENNL